MTRKSGLQLRMDLLSMVMRRPMNLLLASMKVCDGLPGRYLRNASEIDKIIEENHQADEEIAKRYELWGN